MAAPKIDTRRASAQVATRSRSHASNGAVDIVAARRRDDFVAMQTFRPGYPFWQHVFTLPDRLIAFGSTVDGRLRDLPRERGLDARGRVADPALARSWVNARSQTGERREQVAMLLERAAGPVLHNSTRGDALLPNARRYGRFLAEWGAIYERFGVPADIGLAQVILESGLNGKRRSEANAVGFCQWLQEELEAAELLFTDTHRGAEPDDAGSLLRRVSVRAGHEVRIVHSRAVRAQRRRHERGAHLDQRRAPWRRGMSVPDIFWARSWPVTCAPCRGRIRGRLSELWSPFAPVCGDGVRQYLHCQEPEGVDAPGTDLRDANTAGDLACRDHDANGVYLRTRCAGSIRHSSRGSRRRARCPFRTTSASLAPTWRSGVRPPSAAYVAVLDDFMRLDAGPERWDDPAFAQVLADFKRRFRETNTEEGIVMETVLAYAMDQAYTSSRRALLSEFRSSGQVRRLIERGVLELDVLRDAQARLSLQ